MIELRNIGFFKSGINAISSMIPEGNFRFNEKGIHFRAIDPSQVLLVDYFVDRRVFDVFSIEPAFVGLNLEELRKIIERSSPEDKMKMNLTESDLEIVFRNEMERSFKLPLIDVSEDEVNIPEVSYEATIDINSRLLKEILKDASVFSTSIVFRARGDKLFVESKGVSGALNSSSLQSKGIKVKVNPGLESDVASKYSLSYLQNIVREAGPDTMVSMSIKSDSPMKISYNIGPSEIKFYLASMLL
jgi:proliferating cell nuclear antigen